MRYVNKDNITDVFMSYFGDDTDPRLREIGSLASHLHNFARDVNLTHAEWLKGIQFLEAAGHISDETRHEFILLSDVLGLSSLVDMLHSDTRYIIKRVGTIPYCRVPATAIWRGYETRFRRPGVGGLRAGDRYGWQPDCRRRTGYLADSAKWPVFQSGPCAGHLFLSRIANHRCRWPLWFQHGKAGQLYRAD